MGLFDDPNPQQRRQDTARREVERSMRAICSEDGADQWETREPLPGLGIGAQPYPKPGIAIGAAVAVYHASIKQLHDEIANGRGSGLSWEDIGRAIPGMEKDSQEAGMSLAEAAWRYAKWRVRPDEAEPDSPWHRRYERYEVEWRCRTCTGVVYEASPEIGLGLGERERGHKAGCERHAAGLAEERARWDDEDEEG